MVTSSPMVVNPVITFRDKSGLSKTCSPWLVHGMFLMCQYDGWPRVCEDLFEDSATMGPATSDRRISTEAMRALDAKQWTVMADAYLNTLTKQDIADIISKSVEIKKFVNHVVAPSLSREEAAASSSSPGQIASNLNLIGIKLYMAIYLPGEIKDYVNATMTEAQKTLQLSPATLKNMGQTALRYADSSEAPKTPGVENISLLMTTMMQRVGIL